MNMSPAVKKLPPHPFKLSSHQKIKIISWIEDAIPTSKKVSSQLCENLDSLQVKQLKLSNQK